MPVIRQSCITASDGLGFLSSNISFFKREEIDSYLKEYLEEDALIFFKGSRSVKMENIIKNLT